MAARLWMRAILCASFLWTGQGVFAQQFESEKFALRGRVVNAVTREPVGGALVELYSGERRALFSAPDGTFEFADLLRGTYLVTARKPGYFGDRDLGLERPGMDATHTVPTEEDVVIKLTPEGVIYGRVEDEKRRPLEGIGVQAETWAVSNGRKQLQGPGGTVQTDDEGNFRIAGLTPGDYYLKFSEPGGGGAVYRDVGSRVRSRRAGGGKGEGYGTQFYPGVADESMAGVIHVRAGASEPIQQTLEKLRLYEVSGLVNGVPTGSGFSLMLLAAGGAPRGRAQIFPNTGEFRIEQVPAGRYLLQAQAQGPTAERFGRRNGQLVAQTVLDVSADTAGLVLVLGHGATIPVRVSDEGSKTGEPEHSVRVALESSEFPQLSQQITEPPPQIDRLHRLDAFENVAAGSYSVEAWPDGWGYVESMRSAGVDLLKEDLRVGAGTSVAPIEVRLRNDGGELTVAAVENGKPMMARVLVYSEEYPRRSWSLVSLPNSVSGVPNLPPGTYKLVAIRGMKELEFRNPAVMEKYLAHATTVTVAPEAKVTVQVEVQAEEAEP